MSIATRVKGGVSEQNPNIFMLKPKKIYLIVIF